MVIKLLAVLIVIGALSSACSSNQQQPKVSSTNAPGPAATTADQTSKAKAPTAVSRPALSAQIQNVSMYPVPNRSQDLAVSLVVLLKNAGEASVANRWNLEVVASDPSIPSGLTPVHVTGVVDLPGTVNRKVDLGKEDLAVMSAERPIANGSNVEGVLTFILPKTSEQELTKNNVSLVLHFRDATGAANQTPGIVVGSKKSELASKKN